MNSKLHAVTDAAGRPLQMFLTAGQRSDYIGARALLDGLPPAKHMLADRGYDADWYREALENKGIIPCTEVQHFGAENARFWGPRLRDTKGLAL